MSVILDIETVPLEAALQAAYPREDRSPPSNWKDEEKIARWYAEDEAKWRDARVKECSLSPRLGRVVCIGHTSGDEVVSFTAADESGEPELLRHFWDLMESSRGRVVTFNGRTFDLPFLVLRSLSRGIEPSVSSDVVRAWTQRYRVNPHCDVRDLLTNWDSFASGTLAEWCAFVGVPHDEKVGAGGDIYDMHRNNNHAGIAAKCKADVRSTAELYQKVARMFASEAA
jgi:predicted PolB exonuclease-like 3'-5' exonuclease